MAEPLHRWSADDNLLLRISFEVFLQRISLFWHKHVDTLMGFVPSVYLYYIISPQSALSSHFIISCCKICRFMWKYKKRQGNLCIFEGTSTPVWAYKRVFHAYKRLFFCVFFVQPLHEEIFNSVTTVKTMVLDELNMKGKKTEKKKKTRTRQNF